VLSQPRMELIELPDLSVGAPSQIAPPRVSQVVMRDLLEAARCVKAVFKSFPFYFGAALGSILFEETAAKELALAAARSLASMYNPALKTNSARQPS
jgi:hypothetical protein